MRCTGRKTTEKSTSARTAEGRKPSIEEIQQLQSTVRSPADAETHDSVSDGERNGRTLLSSPSEYQGGSGHVKCPNSGQYLATVVGESNIRYLECPCCDVHTQTEIPTLVVVDGYLEWQRGEDVSPSELLSHVVEQWPPDIASRRSPDHEVLASISTDATGTPSPEYEQQTRDLFEHVFQDVLYAAEQWGCHEAVSEAFARNSADCLHRKATPVVNDQVASYCQCDECEAVVSVF